MIPDSLIHVTRGPLTESVHYGHIAVVDRHGRRQYETGAPGLPVFIRSAAKPLQAVAVVGGGAVEAYRFEQRELALVCASHNGEAYHVDAVARLLDRIGLDESFLRCGAHAPYHRPTAKRMTAEGERPTALHNNCSGKHSGMLALSRLRDWPLDSYMSAEHPVQRLMRRTVAELSGLAPEQLAIGVDGCGVPVFGMPLERLAFSYARLVTGEGMASGQADACARVVDAMTRHPEYVAGEDRYDTKLMRATGGRIVGKMGAEGVFAAADRSTGLGLAVKIADGSLRGLYVAVTEALRQLHSLTDEELSALDEFASPDIVNHAGTVVGRLKPVFQLRRS